MEITQHIHQGEGKRRRWRWSFKDEHGKGRMLSHVGGWVTKQECQDDVDEVVEAIVAKYGEKRSAAYWVPPAVLGAIVGFVIGVILV